MECAEISHIQRDSTYLGTLPSDRAIFEGALGFCCHYHTVSKKAPPVFMANNWLKLGTGIFGWWRDLLILGERPAACFQLVQRL